MRNNLSRRNRRLPNKRWVLMAQLDNDQKDQKGELHSMNDDLKQALVGGRTLDRTLGV